MQRTIKPAELANIPGIIAVLEQNLIANRIADVDLEKTGFLVHGFTSDEAKEIITDKTNYVAFVALEDEEIVGYTMGCNIKQLQPKIQTKFAAISQELNYLLSREKIFYYRHIAKKPTTKQVGQELLQSLLAEVKHQNYHSVICQIVQKPLKNAASLAFHARFGFECMGMVQDEKYSLGVYLKLL